MTEHDGPRTPFVDVTLHLLLHLLSLEVNVRTVEVLGIDPCDGLAVDRDIVQEEEVRRSNWPAVSLLLFFDHLGLTAQTHALRFKPVREDVFEQIRT